MLVGQERSVNAPTRLSPLCHAGFGLAIAEIEYLFDDTVIQVLCNNTDGE